MEMGLFSRKTTFVILSALGGLGVCAILIYFLYYTSSELPLANFRDQDVQSNELKDNSINQPTVWVILTFFSISITGLASFVAFKFYSWRQKVDLTGALVPEKWAEHLMALTEAFNSQAANFQKLTSDNVRLSKIVDSNLIEILKQISASKEMLLTFQTSIQEKDLEINRLKLGYDFKIQKDLISQLVQLHSNCSEIIIKSAANKGLTNIEILLRDLLESSGVSITKPPIGTDFSTISDQIESVGYSSDSSSGLEKGQILEVLSDCYLYDSGSRQTVLKPAKIKYYLPDGDE